MIMPGDELLLDGLAFDLLGDEARENAGALGVADEDHAAAIVLVGHVPVPGIDHIIVAADALRQALAFRLGTARGDAQGGERGLAVDGRELAADGAEAGELQLDVVDLHLVDGPVGRPRLVVGDGGIDEEAIDLRIGRGDVFFELRLAVGSDDSGVEIGLARVVGEAGAAEPERRVGEIGVGDIDGGERLQRKWRRRGGAAGHEGQRQRGAGKHCAHWSLSRGRRIGVRFLGRS